jgi:hypothetical protein
MVWWRGQNLDKPVIGPDSTKWYFLVWSGSIDSVRIQRIFFWNESKTETGLVELREDETLHIKRIKDRFAKIAKDRAYRRQFIRPLEFPIERYW